MMEGTLTNAPVWDVYECEGLAGPCNFDIDSAPLANAGDFCNNRSYEDLVTTSPFSKTGIVTDPSGLPPAWVPVNGQYTPTPLQGIVTSFKEADVDLWFTHEQMRFPELDGVDWNMDVVPNPGFKHVLTTERNYVHVEWESFYSRHFFAIKGFLTLPPRAGDGVFLAGRWIIDCGHPTFKSEIHPPAVMAVTRTFEREDDRTETMSCVWVNGYYSGEEVEFNLYPPPRPTPTATLNATIVSGEPLDVIVEDGIGPWSMSLKISAPRKENEVTQFGLYKWDTGRSYEAKYTLFWSE